MRLKDKVAIVTGGSQGIGEAICYAYAREGAVVIVVNKNHPELGKQVAEKIKKSGGRAEAMQCDVADEQSVQALIDAVIKKYQRVDILVNNAAIAKFKLFEEHTLDDWDHIMDVNLKGPFLMSRAVVPSMKKQHSGKIIFIASIAASQGFGLLSAYSASKGGLLALAKPMALELSRHGINVNCISPGSVDTPQTKPFITDPEFLKKISERTATGVPMQPEHLGEAAVFLASDGASAVHGVNLPVDNAWGIF